MDRLQKCFLRMFFMTLINFIWRIYLKRKNAEIFQAIGLQETFLSL